MVKEMNFGNFYVVSDNKIIKLSNINEIFPSDTRQLHHFQVNTLVSLLRSSFLQGEITLAISSLHDKTHTSKDITP